MNAILVRIGIDQSFGGWNAPVSEQSGEFVYFPIPENPRFVFRKGMRKTYTEFKEPLKIFCKSHLISFDDIHYPEKRLNGQAIHLDPDFSFLTYGDNGDRRGSGIAKLKKDDFIVFYAGLSPVEKFKYPLYYGLVGIYFVDQVVSVKTIHRNLYIENAHTRKIDIGMQDIVVRAQKRISGRLKSSILMGEYRNRAYRVTKDLLKKWGGLSVKDGYIQRSAIPPHFLNPKQFLSWLEKQNYEVIERNN